MAFAERLKDLRKAKQLSQEKLAEELKVSRQAISKWEQGLALPDTENLLLLGQYFKVSLDYLLLGVDEKDKPAHRPFSDAVLIFLGCLLYTLTLCLSYLFQYKVYILEGFYSTHASDYLGQSPLLFLVILSLCLIGLGGYRLLMRLWLR